MTLQEWYGEWARNPRGQRLGQKFHSDFIKTDIPGLYYETSNYKALTIIKEWLANHHYVDQMPEKLIR